MFKLAGRTRHTYDISTLGMLGALPLTNGSFASGTFPTAKKVLYVPIRVPVPVLVDQLFVMNGSAVSGNVDVGIYTLAGTKIASSGSTTQAGATQKQLFNVTNFMLGRGVYYMGVSLDNTTGTLTRISAISAAVLRAMGLLTETTGSFGLPATASLGSYADAYLPIMGVLARSVL